MTAKEYLMQVQILNAKCEITQNEIDKLHDELKHPKGIDYSRDKVQTSPEDTMSKMITRVIELQEKLDQEIDEYYDTRIKIRKEIFQLEDARQMLVLYLVYFTESSVAAICKAMKIKERQFRNIHADALREFEQKFLSVPLTAGANVL